MTEPDVRPREVSSTRTWKFAVSKTVNAGKLAALVATDALYRDLARWYADLVLAHADLAGMRSTDALTALERMTVPASGREVPAEWDVNSRFSTPPRDFRRAAINAAVGAVKAHLTAVRAWNDADVKKRGKRPVFGAPGQHPVLYGQQAKIDAALVRGGFVRVKALNPATRSWDWVNVPVVARPGALAALEACDREAVRQRTARDEATIKALASGRVDSKGRPAFTKDERASFRLAVGSCEAQSPTLVVDRRGRASLNVPVTTKVTVVKAEDGRLAGIHDRVVTVDINTFNVSVVAWCGSKVVKAEKMSFGAIQSNRERQVGKAITQSRLCAGRTRGQKQSVRLWQQITDQGETIARQVAAWVTGFATEHDASVIVTEHLKNYRPARRRGRTSKTRRANQRRSYWLRGRIREYINARTIRSGILMVQRNPAWTSHQCPRCHRLGERFSLSRTNTANRSRFRCLNDTCGWTGDADIAAALNLHRKWTRTFTWPTPEERDAHKQRQAAARTAYTSKTPRRRGASGRANHPGTPAPRCARPAMFEAEGQVAA